MKKFTQEDLDKVLGDLHQGPVGERTEGGWDTSSRNHYDNSAKKKEVREKMSNKAKIRHKNGWASPGRYEWTVDNNPNAGGNKGEDNPVYGKGGLYKELTTGFTGNYSDMKNQFPGFGLGFVKRKKIRKDSPYPDYKWVRLNDTRVKGRDLIMRFTPEEVLKIKQVYVEDTTLDITAICKKFGSHAGEMRQILNKTDKYSDDKYGPAIEMRKRPFFICPHCNKRVGKKLFSERHGDKCKFKQ